MDSNTNRSVVDPNFLLLTNYMNIGNLRKC